MASNVFGAKQFKPTAPDKGSFPLDHEGECRVPYLQYMVGECYNASTWNCLITIIVRFACRRITTRTVSVGSRARITSSAGWTAASWPRRTGASWASGRPRPRPRLARRPPDDTDCDLKCRDEVLLVRV